MYTWIDVILTYVCLSHVLNSVAVIPSPIVTVLEVWCHCVQTLYAFCQWCCNRTCLLSASRSRNNYR